MIHGWALAAAAGVCAVLFSCYAPPSAKAPGAENSFDSAAERPPTAKTLYTMARIVIGQKRPRDALPLLREVIRTDPNYLPAYVAIAECQMQSQEFDGALQTLLAGLSKAPNDAVLLNDAGMCYVARENYLLAFDYFTKATAVEPTNSRYVGNRAMAMGMLGRYDAALAAYCQVISPADAHYNVGVLCESRGDFDRATKEFAYARILHANENAKPAQAPEAAAGAMSAATEPAAPSSVTTAVETAAPSAGPAGPGNH
jgi:tetratricopeptide (TPR) repeat protein